MWLRRLWQSEWVQLILSLILIPLLIFLLVDFAPELVKWAGAPFLAIPASLGWVQRVQEDEVILLPTEGPQATFYIEKPGQYAVYADESFWRPGASLKDLRRSPLHPEHPWLRLIYVPTGEVVPLTPVRRGVRPYDEWVVRGRPLYTFRARPGLYRALYEDIPPTYVAIVPDYVTPEEGKLQALLLIQGALILAYPTWRWYRGYRRRRAEQRKKRREAERMWDILRRK